MTATPGAHTAMPPRSRILTGTALVAVLLHGAALWGVHWKTLPVAAPNAPQRQGIAIDLAPAPARASRPAAALTPPRPAEPPQPQETTPPPQPKAETAAPRMRIRPRQQATTPAPARAINGTPGGTAQVPAPAAAPGGTSAASGRTSDPAPASEAVNTKPAYPQLARKRGQEGRVLLRVQTDERGELTDIAVASSSGYPLLDDAALKGVRAWRFTPAIRNGQPVPGTVLVPVEFLLQ